MMSGTLMSCVEGAKPGEMYKHSPDGMLYFVLSNTEVRNLTGVRMNPTLDYGSKRRQITFLGNGTVFVHVCFRDRTDEYWVPIVEL